MPRKKSQSNPLIPLILLCLLALTVYLLYQQLRPAPPPAESSPDLISDDRIIYAGYPRSTGPESAFEILKNAAFITGYSESRKDPLWTAYRVFNNPHPFNLPRPTSNFKTDPRTTAQTKDTDYARSGYDRGHMAPNSAIEHCFGQEAQLQTFLMSNVCPQSPHLNREVWAKLEEKERDYVVNLQEIWVLDGPIFADLNGGPTQSLPAGEAVPIACYKILLDDNHAHPRIFAVIMPQDVTGTELPQQFLVTLHEIEQETHLKFFDKLDEQTRTELENAKGTMW